MEAVLVGMWSFGGADFWNPIGWVVLIVAAVLTVGYLIYQNWDEIVAFIEWVGDGLVTAWNWISETATSIWDSLFPPHAIPIPLTPPIPIVEPITKPIVIPIPIAVPIDITKPPQGGPFNIYDVHVSMPGMYNNYTRGAGFILEFLITGEIYKYGITKYGSVLKRYQTFSWQPKENYIYLNLVSGNFGPLEWYAYRRSYLDARFIENGLITAFVAIRNKFPPGNTGLY